MISCSNSSAGIIVRRFRLIAVVLLGGLLSAALSVADEKAAGEKTAAAAKADADGWQPLFKGKDLDGWKVTNFGGEGDVRVENGDVVITQGADLSG
ncbi:MAG: hypothetical protein ACK6EB_41160, partial [Planctomyces sp.]